MKTIIGHRAAPRTREQWRALAAAYTVSTPEQLDAIADYLIQHPTDGVWHAAAAVSGRLDRCNCAPCGQRRIANARPCFRCGALRGDCTCVEDDAR